MFCQENGVFGDYEFFYKSQHYAGATSNRTVAGTIATTAIKYYMDFSNPYEKSPVTLKLLECYEFLNVLAASREKIVRQTNGVLTMTEAKQNFKMINGNPPDGETVLLHADTYLQALEKAEEKLIELRTVITTRMKNNPHTMREAITKVEETINNAIKSSKNESVVIFETKKAIYYMSPDL